MQLGSDSGILAERYGRNKKIVERSLWQQSGEGMKRARWSHHSVWPGLGGLSSEADTRGGIRLWTGWGTRINGTWSSEKWKRGRRREVTNEPRETDTGPVLRGKDKRLSLGAC